MSRVEVSKQPELHDKRRALILVEDRIGHYAEFRDFFSRTFDLDRRGLAEPGYVTAPSGFTYALVFIGRSGEPFPAGVGIHALVPELEPLDDDVGRPLSGLCADPGRVPVDIPEYTGMRGLHADKIIAAVGCGPEHDALSRRCQQPRCLAQPRRRQIGTIRIEQSDGAVA